MKPGNLIWRNRRRLAVIALLFAVIFCWPVSTVVSGRTRLRVLTEGDAPLVGARVKETWGVYGHGGRGGAEARRTDATGTVEFPPRTVTAFLGPRLWRRANAFLTQCASILVFGKFGSAYTHRWGPLVGLDIDLPPGAWLPAAWPPTTENRDDLVLPIFGDGPHRYIYLRNIDPLRPNSAISGDQMGFIGDTEVILRIRRATPTEEGFIRDSQSRIHLLEYMAKSQ